MSDKFLFLVSDARAGSTPVAEAFAYSLYGTFGGHFWDLAQEHFRDSRLASFSPVKTARSLYLNPHGFRCAKLLVNELSVMLRFAEQDMCLRDVLLGPNTYWIIVRRRNHVARAVSMLVADKTQTYHSYDERRSAPLNISDFTPEEFMKFFQTSVMSDAYLEAVQDINPRAATLFYEDFCLNQLHCLERALASLGLSFADTLKLSQSKLTKSHSKEKAELEAICRGWLLRYYGYSALDCTPDGGRHS